LFVQTEKIIEKIFLFLSVLFFFGCAGSPSSKKIPAPGTEVSQADYLTIVAVGDNIIHNPILNAGYVNGGYNFDSIYDKIRGYIIPADIAFVNQETVLIKNSPAYTGYPLFGSPLEAGMALASAGFDIVNHANNHVMDKGEAGILSSIDFWDSYKDIHYLGIHRSEEERTKRHIIINKNNFRVGFLSYTYGTNFIPLPRGKSWLVSLAERGKMAAEIRALRPLCDYLVVSMHWGEEYRLDYNREQERFAAFLADHRVDLVIGHHSHVLEPLVIMKRSDGGSMPVFYSLGNFLSAHAMPVKEALLGGLMYVKLKKIDKEISIEKIGIIPIITHYDANLSGFTIYPLHEYTEDLAAKHWKRSSDSEMTAAYFIKKARDMFGPALILGNPFREK